MWSPEIKEHFNSNYQRIRKENNLKYGESDFLTLGFINEPPCFPAMEKKDLLTALSAPETSINRTILNDQLKGILDQVTLMVRALAKAKDTPVAKAALFVPNVKEESSSVIDLMDENKANVSLQVAGKKYLYSKSPTLILKVKKGELDSLFISPTFDYNNDNTFFMLCAQS